MRKRAASRSPESFAKPINKQARASSQQLSQEQPLSASKLRAARASAGQRTPATTRSRGAALVQHANPGYAPPARTPRAPAPSPAAQSTQHTPVTCCKGTVALRTPSKPLPTAAACLTANAKALLQVPLPDACTTLLHIFGALQIYHDLCRRRGQRCLWTAAQAAIEQGTKHRTSTAHLLQLCALCPEVCSAEWARGPVDDGGRIAWVLTVHLHDSSGAAAPPDVASPRSPTSRLSRNQTQRLQQLQLHSRLARLVLDELARQEPPGKAPAAATAADRKAPPTKAAAAHIMEGLAAGGSAADVVEAVRDASQADDVAKGAARLQAMLAAAEGVWPWCPAIPQAPMPHQPATPSKASQPPMTPAGVGAATPAAQQSTGRSRIATQLREFARVRRLSFGGGVPGKEEAASPRPDDSDEAVLASLPAALRRRSMDGTLPIALSTIKAMRFKEADSSVANSPAARAQRTAQATNALLPRAFDCVRLMYANEPRAKPMHQVAEALDKLDGTGCQGVDGVHLLRTLATALPEWLTLAGKPGGGCMVVVKAQGVDHGALRGTLVRLAGPRRRLSMGAALRPVLLPNA